jgi:hypothetical protein
MKTRSTILLAGLLAIGLNACGGEETTTPPATPTPGATETAAPSPGASAAPTSGAAPDGTSTAKKDVKDEPFGDPVIPSKVTLVPGLIPGIDAKSRAGQAVQGAGRKDPFLGESSIPVVVTFEKPEGPPQVGFNNSGSNNPTGIAPGNVRSVFGQGPVIPRGSIGAGPGSGTGMRAPRPRVGTIPLKRADLSKNVGKNMPAPGGKAIPGKASPGKSANSAKPIPRRALPLPGTPNVAARPDLPTVPPRPVQPIPTLANAVEVTGVVQIGSIMQAIVKAPDEPTSRYVGVGQRLANGQVLVKRIETAGSEPIVVLEESGVEVIRGIGQAVEGAPAKGEKPAAAAML